MSDKTCESCKHGRFAPDAESGRCTEAPPVLVVVDGYVQTRFPEVDRGCGCGRWVGDAAK